MLEKIKDILYDLSDFLLMFVIVAVIILSISSIMSSTFGIDLQNNASTNIAKDKVSKVDEDKVEKPNTEVTTPKEDEKTNSDETDNSVDNQTDNSNQPDKKDNKDNEGTTTDNTTTNEENNEGNTTDNTTTNEENTEVVFTISQGTTPRDLAKSLKDKKVISDSQKFLLLLVEKKLDTKIRTGTFKLKTNMTNQEVLDVIFKK